MRGTLKVLSLFSGCGGMDLGFEGGFKVCQKSVNPAKFAEWGVEKLSDGNALLPRTRFETVFANDIRRDAKTAWSGYFGKRGHSPDAYRVESVVDLVKRFKDGEENVFPKEVDVVTGGFPCQDFSVAGKRMGFDSGKSHTGGKREADEPTIESRGQLYMWMREVVGLTRPKIFVAENVKGLTNLGDVKEIIESDFRKVGEKGYLVLPARVLLAADYGVPQSRERVIFIGFDKSRLSKEAMRELSKNEIPPEWDPYPAPTHSETGGDGLEPFVKLKDAFKGLKEPDKTDDGDQKLYSKAKFMGRHCQGQTEVNLEGIGPTIRSEHHGNIEFRRLSEENGGKHAKELARGEGQRRLTIRECARIQTFPDDYVFAQKGSESMKNVSASDAYKLIGNAVPPLLAFNLAINLQSKWEKYFPA